MAHNLHVGVPEYSTTVELENEQEQSEDSSCGLRRGRGYTTQSLSWQVHNGSQYHIIYMLIIPCVKTEHKLARVTAL